MEMIACSMNDISLLAKMNKELIEDEKAETKLDRAGLEKRMREFLINDYRAFFFVEGTDIIGYSLINKEETPIYLRQFFICRNMRRKGYGKKAIELLLETLNIDKIDVDVYSWKVNGIKFWQSLGFKTRCYNMRYSR